jgi:hypothetical protein
VTGEVGRDFTSLSESDPGHCGEAVDIIDKESTPAVEPDVGELEPAGYADVGRLAAASAGFDGADQPSATPVVLVLWPGDPEPHVTPVGEHTTYLELIADYCTAIDGFAGGLDEFRIFAADGIEERRLDDTITPGDYGRRLVVAAREKASA